MSDSSRISAYDPNTGDVPGAVPGAPDTREDIVGGAVGPDSGDDAAVTETDDTGSVPGEAGETATASNAPAPSHGVANTQDEPAMDMHTTSVDDKIAGIAAQTQIDVGTEGPERIADVLRQRFADTGIEVSDEDRLALAEQIASRA